MTNREEEKAHNVSDIKENDWFHYLSPSFGKQSLSLIQISLSKLVSVSPSLFTDKSMLFESCYLGLSITAFHIGLLSLKSLIV